MPRPWPFTLISFASPSKPGAVDLARAGGPRPSASLTQASLCNAVVALQAIGGSTNAVIHLAAIMGRLGLT